MSSNKLEMVKCESLRLNMFQKKNTEKSVDFPVTIHVPILLISALFPVAN